MDDLSAGKSPAKGIPNRLRSSMHGKPGGYLAYLGPGPSLSWGPAPVPGSKCTSRMTVLGVIVFDFGPIVQSAR
jgi:hypothetical protein